MTKEELERLHAEQVRTKRIEKITLNLFLQFKNKRLPGYSYSLDLNGMRKLIMYIYSRTHSLIMSKRIILRFNEKGGDLDRLIKEECMLVANPFSWRKEKP